MLKIEIEPEKRPWSLQVKQRNGYCKSICINYSTKSIKLMYSVQCGFQCRRQTCSSQALYNAVNGREVIVNCVV